MSFKIELSETQYNKIIKFALSEEKKKTLLNEGASSMVMSDLKNKIQARMKGSLKIGPKLKNYPTAIDIIDFMHANKDRLREVSLRMALKIADLRKSFPNNWKRMSETTCMKSA